MSPGHASVTDKLFAPHSNQHRWTKIERTPMRGEICSSSTPWLNHPGACIMTLKTAILSMSSSTSKSQLLHEEPARWLGRREWRARKVWDWESSSDTAEDGVDTAESANEAHCYWLVAWLVVVFFLPVIIMCAYVRSNKASSFFTINEELRSHS